MIRHIITTSLMSHSSIKILRTYDHPNFLLRTVSRNHIHRKTYHRRLRHRLTVRHTLIHPMSRTRTTLTSLLSRIIITSPTLLKVVRISVSQYTKRRATRTHQHYLRNCQGQSKSRRRVHRQPQASPTKKGTKVPVSIFTRKRTHNYAKPEVHPTNTT